MNSAMMLIEVFLRRLPSSLIFFFNDVLCGSCSMESNLAFVVVKFKGRVLVLMSTNRMPALVEMSIDHSYPFSFESGRLPRVFAANTTGLSPTYQHFTIRKLDSESLQFT